MTYKHTIAQSILGWFAQRIISKYHPRVIGITGSVGKTSAKEAVACVLAGSFTCRKGEKNFNTEIGVPFVIIGIRDQPRTWLDWAGVLLSACRLVLFRDASYPAVLILEMGADHPGDIARLTAIAPCDIGVVTAVGPTHLEYFQTVENVSEEKSLLVTHIRAGGTAILNHDDPLVYPMRERVAAHTLSYGFAPSADVRALEMKTGLDCLGPSDRDTYPQPGTLFKVSVGGAAVPVRLPGHLGNPSVYAALAAIAVGKAMGLNLHDITERLASWKGVPGRLSFLPGVRRTFIIDDSYNSSPLAVLEALSLLGTFAYPTMQRRWAVLGDMLELGGFTHAAHREAGAAVINKGKADFLVTVGERARDIARAAQAGGMAEERVYVFAEAEEAGRFIQNKMEEGDVLLIKGSRGMHMERIVRELMAEPLRANELLAHSSS